jgi:hypothetical protein
MRSDCGRTPGSSRCTTTHRSTTSAGTRRSCPRRPPPSRCRHDRREASVARGADRQRRRGREFGAATARAATGERSCWRRNGHVSAISSSRLHRGRKGSDGGGADRLLGSLTAARQPPRSSVGAAGAAIAPVGCRHRGQGGTTKLPRGQADGISEDVEAERLDPVKDALVHRAGQANPRP